MQMTKTLVQKYLKNGWMVKQKQPNSMFVANKKNILGESNHISKQQKS